MFTFGHCQKIVGQHIPGHTFWVTNFGFNILETKFWVTNLRPPAEQIWMQNFWSESSWCSGYWKYRLWFCFMNTISKCAFCYSFKQQFFQHPGIRRDFPYIGNSKTSFVLKHILVCWSGILPHLVHFTMEMKEKENKCFERSWRKHVQLQSTRTLFQRKQKSQQIKVRQNYVGTPQDGLVLAVQKCLQTAQYSYIGELVTDWLLRTFEKHLLGANKSTNIAHKTNQYPKYDSDPSNKSDMGPDHTGGSILPMFSALQCNGNKTADSDGSAYFMRLHLVTKEYKENLNPISYHSWRKGSSDIFHSCRRAPRSKRLSPL